MTTTQTAAATAEQATAHLEALSAEIDKLGWITRLTAGTGRAPCLYVQNPAPGAAALSEHIYAAPKAGGWWFWWSWAEPIAQDTTATATIICRILRTAARKDTARMTISPLSAPRAQQLSQRPHATTQKTTIDWLGEMYLYLQLAEILRNQIRSGQLPPGQTLPPIRQLATQHKIANRTVRQGIAILEQEHLVEVMPRQGFRVLEP